MGRDGAEQDARAVLGRSGSDGRGPGNLALSMDLVT